jgi:hypothetical protein
LAIRLLTAMKLKEIFPALFTTPTAKYNYSVGSREAKSFLDSLFINSGKLFSEPDFSGSFYDGNNFSLYVDSGAFTWGIFYGSTLFGKLYENDDRLVIETIVKPSWAFKLMGVIFILAGIGMLYACFVEFTLSKLFWGLGLTFLSPFLCNKFADIANGVVEDRYEDYIDKSLKKLSAANSSLPKAINITE